MGNINKNYAVLTIIVFLSLIIVSSLPSEYLFSRPSICLHYRIFGVQCPFCGMLRAVNCFVHFDFIRSWQYNYNVFLMAFLLPVLFMRIFTQNKWIIRTEKVILILLAIGFSLIYIVRIVNLKF